MGREVKERICQSAGHSDTSPTVSSIYVALDLFTETHDVTAWTTIIMIYTGKTKSNKYSMILLKPIPNQHLGENNPLPDPDVTLGTPHPTISVITAFLCRSRLPYLPEFKVLVPGTGRDGGPIGTETTTQHSTIVGRYVIDLLQRRVRP